MEIKLAPLHVADALTSGDPSIYSHMYARQHPTFLTTPSLSINHLELFFIRWGLLLTSIKLSNMAQPVILHRAPRVLQPVALSEYKNQHRVGYFSLPAEIRNMIMELILVNVPGYILLTASEPENRHCRPGALQGKIKRVVETVSKRNSRDSKSTRTFVPDGFQLLATCKQACAEGHTIFYSSNTFHFPPGPLDNTHRALKTLQPQHHAMIKSVGIRMHLEDLTLAVFEDIHFEMRGRYLSNLMARPNAAQAVRWGTLATKRLMRIWVQKSAFLLAHWDGYPVLENAFPSDAGEESEAQDEIMADMARLIEEEDDAFWTTEKSQAIVRIARLCGEIVEDVVRNDGWKALRAMVRKGWVASLW